MENQEDNSKKEKLIKDKNISRFITKEGRLIGGLKEQKLN